jgi:hypothetical protein
LVGKGRKKRLADSRGFQNHWPERAVRFPFLALFAPFASFAVKCVGSVAACRRTTSGDIEQGVG